MKTPERQPPALPAARDPARPQTSQGRTASWRVDTWFNTAAPLSLEALRGRVVVVLAFQMLCPGCVSHALPLAARVHRQFPHDRVAMIGLHTVFEHHAAMTPTALAAFLHEYRIAFPVGVDRPDSHGGIPHTMRAYAMRGTPTWLLFDAQGRLHAHWFGDIDALPLGARIGALLEAADDAHAPVAADPDADAGTAGENSTEHRAEDATEDTVGNCADGPCMV
jgi:AhpC/TSA family